MNDLPILFYSPGTCALGAIVALEWVAHPYALCRVERAARATPEFRRINPQGKVPALRTRGRFRKAPA